jgi:arylsulfatase A-like enzyme
VLLDDKVAPAPPPAWESGKVKGTVSVPCLWWDARAGSLYALSEKALANVRVEYEGDPLAHLPRAERMRGGDKPIEPRSLVEHVELGKVDRLSIHLPAPATIEFPIDAFDADQLALAVGVIDEGFRRTDDCIEPARGLSDGVTFAVEVECEGKTARVWSHDVARAYVGRSFDEARIDLARFRGKSLKLRLRSLPGSAGDASFDYAVWSGLRLYGRPSVRPSRPHVVLIDVDTLRSDRLGCYDYPRKTSPQIDAWAKDAVVYRDVLSCAPWTLPSTTSILTGLYVHQHGVDQFPKIVSPETPTLAMLLSASGYETYGIAEGGYVRGAFGFNQGFDFYDCSKHKRHDWKQAVNWLRARKSERPFFLFLHTYLVHAPYQFDDRFEHECEPPYTGWLAGKEVGYDNVIEPFNRKSLELSDADRAYVNRLYDALVADADEMVGYVLTELDKTVGLDDVVVAITSDHGEEFFEHGQMGHGQSLHDELLRVPLIIRYPRSRADRPTGQDQSPVSSVDIVPTLLDAAGLEIPKYLPGRSLLRADQDPSPRLAAGDYIRESIEQNGFKMICEVPPAHPDEPVPVALYAIEADRTESTNLLEQQAETAQKIRDYFLGQKQRFPPIVSGPGGEAAPGGAALEELRKLGYLTGNGTH